MVDPTLFAPGAQVLLEAPLATLPCAASVIRGLHPQRYLILDQPLCKGREVRFDIGLDLMVRLIAGEKVVIFGGKCLGHCQAPERVLFIAYPTEVEYGQIRKGKNYPVLFDALLDVRSGQVALDRAQRCMIMSMSSDGCLLQTDSPQPFGAKLFLDFALPEVGPVTGLEATVRSCQRGNRAWMLEVIFDPADERVSRQIQEYLRLLDQRQLDDAMLRLSTLD